MKCSHIRRILIDEAGRALTAAEAAELSRHFAECVECSRLKADLEEIRSAAGILFKAEPPAGLRERIRLACLDRIEEMEKGVAPALSPASAPRIPKVIWGVLSFVVALTAVGLILFFRDFQFDQPITGEKALMLSFVVQNFMMLCFSPLLLKNPEKFRATFRGLGKNFMNSEFHPNGAGTCA